MSKNEIIESICYEIEDQDQAIALVDNLDSSSELYELLDHYNWDDGFGVPIAIANHEKCDLAVAQKLYWLAGADYWYVPEEEVNIYNKEHYDFSNLISQRLLSGHYQIGELSHTESFARVQLYKFRKRSFPEVFYLPVVGKNA
jgi:hypothetical protein